MDGARIRLGCVRGCFSPRELERMRSRKASNRFGRTVPRTPYGATVYGALRTHAHRAPWTPPGSSEGRPYLYSPTRIALTFQPKPRIIRYPTSKEAV